MIFLGLALLLSCIGDGEAQLVLGKPGVCPVTKYYSDLVNRPGFGPITVWRSVVVPKCCNGFTHRVEGDSCIQMLCPDLTEPDSGDMTCSSPRMTVSTQCHFSCNNGFELESSSTPTRTCQMSGVWSGTEAVCKPLTCPDLDIPELRVVQPCHQEYNDTCTFTCSRGYYFDSSGNSTLQMSCDLDNSMTGVQWSDSPYCKKLDVCDSTTNPCLHGSTCVSVGLTSYECDCTGTGYAGKNCELGIVTISEIPHLIVSQPFLITLEAKPEKKLTIWPITDSSARILFSPERVRFFQKTQNIQIKMTPKKVGVFTISFRLSGVNRNVFMVPSNQTVVVVNPRLTPPGELFQYRGLRGAVRQRECCSSPPLNICSSNVIFTSSCALDAATNTTPGVVFAKNSALTIPLGFSLSTAVMHPETNPLQVDIGLQPSRSCGNCTECAVEAYYLVPGDILNFHHTQALATTFIHSTRMLLPVWISFHFHNSSGETTKYHHMIRQSQTLNMQTCRGFISENYSTNINDHHFVILVYNGLADIVVDSTNLALATVNPAKPLCIAVDMCLARDSPVFVVLPSIASPNFLNYSSRGWTITVSAFSLSTTVMSNTSYNILLRGSLNLTNVISIESVMIDFTIQGEGGFQVPDVHRVFSDGLETNSEGIMKGILQLDIRTESGSPLYSLESDKEHATFSIGGVNQANPCGQPTISGKIIDNQLTRVSSVITAFLEIPPNLRHGDRYQFDCGLAYTIYTDASATVNGMVLNTSCHELRIAGLLVQDLVQTVYFGQQKQPACLPMDVDSSIDTYPVIGIALGTGTAKLGHLMSQDQPLIEYGLNPQTGGYSAVMYDVTVMIYPTDFTVDVRVDSNPNRLYFSEVATVGGYPFRTSVTANTDNEWESISLDVVGVADSGSGKGLLPALQNTTLQSLQAMADAAIESVNTAQLVVANSISNSRKLVRAKYIANTTIMNLRQELELIDRKVKTATNNIARLRQQLSTLGVNIVSLRNRLNSFCYFYRCHHTCIPGNVNSTCNVTRLVDIPGTCVNTTYQWVQVNILIRQVTIRCESWASAIRQAQNCGCGAIFSNCFCVATSVTRCVWGQCSCAIDYFQTVRYQKPVDVNVPCVIGQRSVVTPIPCQMWSDCSRTRIDVHCERANNACYSNRTNFANTLDVVEEEARDIIAEVQRNQRITISLYNNNKRAQLLAAQRRLDALNIECDKFARSSQIVDIPAIRRNNQVGLDLARLLNNAGFTVNNISFSTAVTREAIHTVTLLVTFTVGSISIERTLSVPFDFDNPNLYLAHAARHLSNAIININSPSLGRGKRQVEVKASSLKTVK